MAASAFLQGLIDAYGDELAVLSELAESLDSSEWALPTELPGWSVHDNFAHVADLERHMIGEATTHEPDWSTLPFITTPWQQFVERGVDERRTWSREQVIGDMRSAGGAHLTALHDPNISDDTEMMGLMGRPMLAKRILRVRVFDLWAHEQDVRRATNRPGNLYGPAAFVARDRICDNLANAISNESALPPNSSVRIHLHDEQMDSTVTVATDEAGQLAPPDVDIDDPTVTMIMDWPMFVRVTCGRIDPETALTHIDVHGDDSLAVPLLSTLVVTP
jgi:uncharacterized protein (TIGR03083 family)